jgi:hypothetical protein
MNRTLNDKRSTQEPHLQVATDMADYRGLNECWAHVHHAAGAPAQPAAGGISAKPEPLPDGP